MIHPTNSPLPRIAQLERQVAWLKRYTIVLTALLVSLPLLAFYSGQQEEVLRARGLIIEDAKGRERILIGAPLPSAPHRIRTDAKKVEKAWGDRFPDMAWYKRLNHSSHGILILDEKGHDRICIGDPVPDPNIGRRISPATGLSIQDESGFERSGWGYFEQTNRVGFGLDHRGGEALNLFVHGDGSSGLIIRDSKGKRQTFLGHAEGGHFANRSDDPVHGLTLSGDKVRRLVIDAHADSTRIDAQDAKGEPVFRLPAK